MHTCERFTPMACNERTSSATTMWGCLGKCWKALKTFKTIGTTKKYNGEARFINAGMLGEMFESIEVLVNH